MLSRIAWVPWVLWSCRCGFMHFGQSGRKHCSHLQKLVMIYSRWKAHGSPRPSLTINSNQSNQFKYPANHLFESLIIL